MSAYKWDSVYDWFEGYIDRLVSEGETSIIAEIAKQFAMKAGNDEIQDLYQSKMEEDGFFRKEYSLEEFKKKLESSIKEMDSYKEDSSLDEEINSPGDWLESYWKESFESLYESYGGDADEAVGYIATELFVRPLMRTSIET